MAEFQRTDRERPVNLETGVRYPEGLPCACNRGTISEKWKTETHGGVERFSAVGKHGEMA